MVCLVEYRAKKRPRGRPPTPIEILRKRRSWKFKTKTKIIAPPPKIIRRRTCIRLGTLEKHCRQKVPGYDPWRNAGNYWFDVKAAAKAIKFFHNELSHVKGAKARTGFILEPWQQAVVGNLFGWKDKDGWRRYRELFLYVGRKNGKTPLAAGIISYILFEDREPGAEIYGAAAKYSQAALLFVHVKGMITNNPRLAERCQIFKGQAKSVQLNGHPKNVDDVSVYAVISAEHSEGHGQNTSAAVIDELHLQPNRELLDSMMTAMASEDRKQPLFICISTADFEREGSICNEKHDYAKMVRDGIIDNPTFLPVIYEADRKDDWTKESIWRKANPNLGVSVSLDYLRRECDRAQELPSYENTFKRLHLNIRTEQDIRWLSMESWQKCNAKIEEKVWEGKTVYAGLDIGATSDLTALCIVFHEKKIAYARWWFWTPKAKAREREKQDRVPYLTWSKQGFIKLTEGNETDYSVVRADINKIGEKYHIAEIAVDRLFQGAQLCQDLGRDGFEIINFGQGYLSMAAPTLELEKRVNRQEFRHGDNPVLNWMAANVSVEMDAAGNLKPSKRKSSDKIDGIVAAIMALGRATAADDPVISIYEQRIREGKEITL